MFQILSTIYNILSELIYIYSVLVVVYALLSWVPSLMNTKFGDFLGRIVNPYLSFFDRIIPSFAGISFSPVVALLVLYAFNKYVLYFIFSFLVRILVG